MPDPEKTWLELDRERERKARARREWSANLRMPWPDDYFEADPPHRGSSLLDAGGIFNDRRRTEAKRNAE